MRQLKITKQITGRESYSIEKYLQEIGKIHVLSPEEEADLAKKIRSGDRAAREKLVLSNLRFVVSVAKQYQNHGLTLGDLINEGNVGLIKAAECFDECNQYGNFLHENMIITNVKKLTDEEIMHLLHAKNKPE